MQNEYKNRRPTGGAQNIGAHGRGIKHKRPMRVAQDNEGPTGGHSKSKALRRQIKEGP